MERGNDLMDTTLTYIGIAIGWVIGLGGLFLQYLDRRSKKKKDEAETELADSDSDKSKAETMYTYEQVLKMASERAEKVEARLVAFEGKMAEEKKMFEQVIFEKDRRIDQLLGEIRVRDEAIAARDETIAELRDWAERLVFQIQSFGAVPVPMQKPSLPLKPAKNKK